MNKVSENPLKNRTHTLDTSLMIVTGLFVTLYLTSNIMAVKVTFPFAYMLGDVLTEVWGYRTARKVIWLTLLCNVVMVCCTAIGGLLPAPDYMADTAAAYQHVFNYVPRIVLASLVGFLFGELSNAYLMERIKHMTRGRFLWVRTIASSMVGYIFDSIPFVLIAFYGTVSTPDLLKMIAFQYVSKLAIEAFAGTPMAYAVIKLLKSRD